MAKNKKPRKKYVPKNYIKPWRMKAEDLKELRSMFTDVELIVYTKLPAGNCTDGDLYTLRDVANWGVIVASVREWYPEEQREEVCNVSMLAAEKITELQVRGREHGGRYVCKAEELSAIREAFDFLGEFMQKSLTECPVQTIKEWCVMRVYSQKAMAGKPVKASVKELINAVKNF